jgi:hypothetical protein
MKKLYKNIGNNIFKLISENSENVNVTPEIFGRTVKLAVQTILDMDDIVLRSSKDVLKDQNLNFDDDLYYWYSATVIFRYDTPTAGLKTFHLKIEIMYDSDEHKPKPTLTVKDLKNKNPKIVYVASLMNVIPGQKETININTVPIEGTQMLQYFEFTNYDDEIERHRLTDLIKEIKNFLDRYEDDDGDAGDAVLNPADLF